MEEAGGHTFRSFVRGVPVDFSPGNIRTVMRFRTQVQGATTNFETKKEHDQQLDQVLAYLCMPGATWKLSTGQLRVPIQLRRQELNRVARGWHEFSIHSLIPSSNRSKIPVIRAILIHCIMRGEDVKAEDIIADKIVRQEQREMVQEIQQIKNYQVNQTLADSTRHKAYLEELAAMKIKQEEFFSNHVNQYNMIRQDQRLLGKEILDHANFSEIQRQLRDWTRNASARETYMVWAHQQANPNLVEMSSQKIVKQIYDNIDHKRPMFKGLLNSDLQPSDSAPPPSSSNDPKDPPK
ncbi:hypothetical protein PIB30_086106 [Stylosanthes scabra]|uniref:Putative plant transposon protein domain-containing protein n=1 Tax=Stylosanthes scabra TaxID=79078 RepID=A0ABU6QSJ4_9FABA|nr:hypothetical protein [Stylosanthes scabra]